MPSALPGAFFLKQMGRDCSDQMRRTKMEGAIAPGIHLFLATHPRDRRRQSLPLRKVIYQIVLRARKTLVFRALFQFSTTSCSKENRSIGGKIGAPVFDTNLVHRIPENLRQVSDSTDQWLWVTDANPIRKRKSSGTWNITLASSFTPENQKRQAKVSPLFTCG